MPIENPLVLQNLRRTTAHGDGRLTLTENPRNRIFVNDVLDTFDRTNLSQLGHESRVLSGAETNTGGVFLPASYQREVIRAALSDLAILDLIRAKTDPLASATTSIPYEERTASPASIPNHGVVYEGAGIPFSGVSLRSETAYIQAMKLALKVTNEVIYFSEASGVNWNAWAENIASNARVIRELIHLRIASEVLRASDSYQAQTATDTVTVDSGGKFKTSKFPIVRPFQSRDLRGTPIGTPLNPVTVKLNDVDIPYFVGGDLPNGQYWKFDNLNMGYIQIVDQAGNPAGSGSSVSIAYSYATNIIKFDLNHPDTVKYSSHLNDLLSAIGDQKATLNSKRFSRPEYLLMSNMLNNEVTKAEQFIVSLKRDGTNTTLNGDFEVVKGVPVFDSNSLGDFRDQRMVLGQTGLTAYVVAKPYTMGRPFEAVDDKGQPTGEKAAYGEEYSVIHTPAAVCGRYTSILVYDSTTR